MNLQQYIEQTNLSETDPQTALQLALAENEKLAHEAEIRSLDFKTSGEIEYNDDWNIKKASFNGLQRLAKLYSESEIVPKHFQKKPADCYIAIHSALQCKIPPITFLQHCYVVHGKPGIDAQLAMSMTLKSGRIQGRFRKEYSGEGGSLSCTVTVIDKASGEAITETLDMQTAERMGWVRGDSMWSKIPAEMLYKRACMWLLRHNYPDVLLGLYSTEELKDMEADLAVQFDPETSSRIGELVQPQEPKKAPEPEPEEKPAKKPPAKKATKAKTEGTKLMDFEGFKAAIRKARSVPKVEEYMGYVKQREDITDPQFEELSNEADQRVRQLKGED